MLDISIERQHGGDAIGKVLLFRTI